MCVCVENAKKYQQQPAAKERRAKNFLLNGMCFGLHFKWRKSRRSTHTYIYIHFGTAARSTKRFPSIDCYFILVCYCCIRVFFSFHQMETNVSCILRIEFAESDTKATYCLNEKWPFSFIGNVVVFVIVFIFFLLQKANNLLCLRIRIHNEWKISVERKEWTKKYERMSVRVSDEMKDR